MMIMNVCQLCEYKSASTAKSFSTSSAPMSSTTEVKLRSRSDVVCSLFVFLLYAVPGLRWVLLVVQHWAHSRNRPTATDEKTRKVFSIFVAISLVDTVSGKSLKLLPPDITF